VLLLVDGGDAEHVAEPRPPGRGDRLRQQSQTGTAEREEHNPQIREVIKAETVVHPSSVKYPFASSSSYR